MNKTSCIPSPANLVVHVHLSDFSSSLKDRNGGKSHWYHRFHLCTGGGEEHTDWLYYDGTVVSKLRAISSAYNENSTAGYCLLRNFKQLFWPISPRESLGMFLFWMVTLRNSQDKWMSYSKTTLWAEIVTLYCQNKRLLHRNEMVIL